MTNRLQTEPLTAQAFAPFGDVIEADGAPEMMINSGEVERYHDRGRLDFSDQGRAGLSMVKAKGFTLPYTFKMLERHPHGSQSFMPMQAEPFLVIVAPDKGGKPGAPRAFLTAPGQGINYHRNVWHGVLAPLSDPALFTVVDWIGEGVNLEEYWLETPYVVETTK